jgi:TfoX/Sxy family transcriptional regulator of competence genes
MLRRTRFPQPTYRSVFGGYGDGRFCGLSCGYRWANLFLDKHLDYETVYRKSMMKALEEKEKSERGTP